MRWSKKDPPGPIVKSTDVRPGLNVRRLGNLAPTGQPACRQRIISRCLQAGVGLVFWVRTFLPIICYPRLILLSTFILFLSLFSPLIEIPPHLLQHPLVPCPLLRYLFKLRLITTHSIFFFPILFLILCPCSLVVIGFWNTSLGNVFSPFLSVHSVFFAPSLSPSCTLYQWTISVSSILDPHLQ